MAVAPPLNYNIPLVVNSYWWLYGFIVAALLGMYLISTDFPLELKIVLLYLFVGCFFSMVPYLSFNALALVVASAWAFFGFMKGEEAPVVNMVVAAFWVQAVLAGVQLLGMDKLMNFDRPQPVFLGTVMQYMRFGSLLAIMAPILVLKSRLYVIPVAVLCVLSRSSSFALAVISGVTAYYLLRKSSDRVVIIILALSAFGLYWMWDRGSWITAFACGRLPAWDAVIRTWCMNTMHKFVLPLTGPVDWKSIFFGRGMDSFMPLFPIFKHDTNPFAQAHNCHLQLVWELGLVGYGLLSAYMLRLLWRLRRLPLYVGGLMCMLVNMFFAFPTRITQTMFMMVAYLALCEKKARELEWEGAQDGC